MLAARGGGGVRFLSKMHSPSSQLERKRLCCDFYLSVSVTFGPLGLTLISLLVCNCHVSVAPCFFVARYRVVFSHNFCVVERQTVLCCKQFSTREVCFLPKLVRQAFMGGGGCVCLLDYFCSSEQGKHQRQFLFCFPCVKITACVGSTILSTKIPAETNTSTTA